MNTETKKQKKQNLQGKKKMRMNYHVFMYLATSQSAQIEFVFYKMRNIKKQFSTLILYLKKKTPHSSPRDREPARAINIFLSIRFKWDSYKLYFNQKCPCPCTFYILPSHFRIGGKTDIHAVGYLIKYFSEILFNHFGMNKFISLTLLPFSPFFLLVFRLTIGKMYEERFRLKEKLAFLNILHPTFYSNIINDFHRLATKNTLFFCCSIT